MIIIKKLILNLSLTLILFQLTAQTKQTITFQSEDDVVITADLYMTNNQNAPFILLFHQAMFSRGEYNETAPKLNKLGFNCLAVDQRSGLSVNKITNETHKFAKGLGKKTKYENTYPDLQASLNYITKTYQSQKIIVWGSSYSASLVFVLAAKNKKIDGVLAFSPGEYFKFENKTIQEWVKEVECPVFVTSSQNESNDCKNIFNSTGNPDSKQYIPEHKGFHGSKALWDSKKGNQNYWEHVKLFLSKFTY